MTLWTEDPRLVALYDIKCEGRDDHDFYLALANRVGAKALVDIGCGTGVFAVDASTSANGERRHVIGVDPGAEMLAAARTRDGGERVQWMHGTATLLDDSSADLIIMMGHVAQYFVTDTAWNAVLAECHRVLKPHATLAFEVRNPDRDWPARWTQARTTTELPHPEGGHFTSWVETVEVVGPPDDFIETHEGHSVLPNGDHLVSQETLRFRPPSQVKTDLEAAGFSITNTWGDWDSRAFELATSDEFIIEARRL